MKLLKLLILFLRNSYGCLSYPYLTYRKLSNTKTDVQQTLFIFILIALYFLFAGLIRSGMKNPFILTLKFSSLIFSFLTGFVIIMLLFYLAAKLTKTDWVLRKVFILWSYSLWPTLIWFLVTSILYLLLPPPRSFSMLGKLYSLIFISFSLALLLWKFILYFLTLRFGLKFNFYQIGLSSLIIFPILSIYSVVMYRLGIFRIPFI